MSDMLEIAIVAVGTMVLLAVPIWLLWNWLMPDIFGLTTITLWQALGVSVLSACLFKSSPSSSLSKS